MAGKIPRELIISRKKNQIFWPDLADFHRAIPFKIISKIAREIMIPKNLPKLSGFINIYFEYQDLIKAKSSSFFSCISL